MSDTNLDLNRQENASWLRDAIAAEGTAPFVLVNASRPQASPADIMTFIRPRLPYGLKAVAMLRTTPQAVGDVGLQMRPDQRKDFCEGVPVLFVSLPVPALPERKRGRQEITGDIARTRDALYVNVALSVGRIRACDDRREGKQQSPSVRRPLICERIADDVARGRFHEGDVGKRRFSFTQNAFREGQSQLPLHFPGVKAGDALKTAYQQVYDVVPGSIGYRRKEHVERERLRTLSWLHLRAQNYSDAQHAMSVSMRDRQEISPAQRQMLSHAREGGPSLDALMDAAIFGDVNPGHLVANFASWSTDFAVGQRLGRMSRCHEIVLEPMHCERIGLLLKRGAAAEDNSGPEYRTAQVVRTLALELLPEEHWWQRINASENDGMSHMLSRRPL